MLVNFQETIDDEDKAIGDASKRKILGLVSAIFERGRRWYPRLLPRNPAAGIFEMPSGKREVLVRAAPIIVIERLREWAMRRPVRDPLTALRDGALIACMGETIACRPRSELLLNATWGDIYTQTLLLQRMQARHRKRGLKAGARCSAVCAGA